jgi:cell wall-associated NlpC family hydrolase
MMEVDMEMLAVKREAAAKKSAGRGRGWTIDAGRVENVTWGRRGDFLFVEGTVTNITQNSLPHLLLRIKVYNTKGRLILTDDFHLTNRRLRPAQTSRFKYEGEWKEGISAVKVNACPYPSELDIAVDPSPLIKIRELNPLQDELSVGDKKAMVQAGDLIFARVDDVLDKSAALGGPVRLLTRSPYYHMLIYDHDGKFVHAFWPTTEENTLERFYLCRPNLLLSWGRPVHRDGREASSKEGARAVKFAKTQIGKPYDVGANFSYLFRSDGIQKMPYFLRRFFDRSNRLKSSKKWQCSGLACAAWYHAAGIVFADNLRDLVYLSPADIAESIYCTLICNLKVIEGEPLLLTRGGS